MKPADDLFQLIHSLDKGEKRKFQLIASRYGGSRAKYSTKIFTLISRQKVYDEEALKHRLKSPSAVRMLPQLKIYLQNQILSTLKMQHKEGNTTDSILHLMLEQRIYAAKKLFHLQEKNLQKLHGLTESLGDPFFEIYALNMAGRLILESDPAALQSVISRFRKREMDLLRRLVEERKLKYLYYELWHLYERTRQANHPETLKRIDGIAASGLLQSEKVPTGFQSQWYYYRCHYMIHMYHHNDAESREACRRIIALFEANPLVAAEQNFSYAIILVHYLATCNRMRQYDDFETIIGKLKKLKIERSKKRVILNSHIILFEQLYLMNTGDIGKAVKYVSGVDDFIQSHRSDLTLSRILTLYSNNAVSHFLNEDPAQAMIYVKKILDDRSDVRPDIKYKIQIMQLLLYYDMSELRLLPYLIRSARRNFQLHNKLGTFEKSVFRYLARLLKSASNKEKQECHRDFYHTLSAYTPKDGSIHVNFHEELLYWLGAKVTHKTVREYMAQALSQRVLHV